MPRSKKSTAATSSTVDTISSLPDAILCHILSFVTTKEAVATSILSKRWIHLWHHVPNLNFPYFKVDTFESILLFNEFVYSVLLSRETAGSNVINDFNLDIQYENPNLAFNLGLPNITKWINFAVQRKLEYLRLHIHVDNLDDNGDDYEDNFYNLPFSIFTCRTLVSLDLRWFRVEGFAFDSSGFQFPSLKTLRLEHVNFSEVRDFMLFIAGCPILEDIKISEMGLFAKEDSLIIQEFKTLSLTKLIRADIVGFHCPFFPVNALSTSKDLSIHTMKVLEQFYTEDHRVNTVCLIANTVNQLQRPCDDVPIFHNLTHLELHNRWDLVVQVLHQCPKLQNLRLHKGLSDSMGHEDFINQENWVEPKFVPQCLLLSLRTFIIQDFSDLKSDLMLEQYILKNARILRTIKIRSSVKQPKMRRTLSRCPMASPTCQISLSATI